MKSYVRRFTSSIIALVMFAVPLQFAVGQVSAISNGTQLISLGNGNIQPNNGSLHEDITPDGRHVVFASYANNLTSVLTSGTYTQIYERDLTTGLTQMVSVNNGGTAGNHLSDTPIISSNGRYVLFNSNADNLVPGFPVTQDGTVGYCYLRDLQQGTTMLINPFANDFNGQRSTDCEAISGNGNYIIFQSGIPSLSTLPGGYSCNNDPCNWQGASFILNIATGSVVPTIIDNSGNAGAISSGSNTWFAYADNGGESISDDGSIITYMSTSPLVPGAVSGLHAYARNLAAGSLELITPPNSPYSVYPVTSGDGAFVAYSTTGAHSNIFERNLHTGIDVQVDVTPAGGQPDAYSDVSSISTDGTYIGFRSASTDLVPAGSTQDMHVYVRNMQLNITTQADINSDGQQAVQSIGMYIVSQQPVVTNSGSLAFWSYANNFGSAPAPQIYLSPLPSYTPAAPTLIAPSPTQTASLSWSYSSAATSYNIYRNGTNIASAPAPTSSTVTYTDITAPEGTNTYYVTAVNSSGESSPSNSVNVLVDRTGPNVTGTPDSNANSNGWYNHDVTINWNSVDPSPSSGTPTQPTPTTANLEGNNSYTSDPSCDPVNNCSTGNLTLKIDKTAPTISYTVTPTPNFSNWNKTDAVVTFTCTDAISGIDSCTPPVTISNDGGNQTVTGTAVDKAGNTATVTATVNLDKTAPTITSALSQSPNANGWNNTPVTVSYTCTDATSGIASCPTPQTESTDGTYALSGTAVDNAGNTSTTSNQVNIDQTAPAITYTVSPSLNSNGWSTSNTVTVTFNCSDALSGIDTCTAPVTLTGDGAYVVTGTATDKAGNSTSINALVGIDTTAPTITAAVSPTPSTSGWNRTAPVTVTFTCTDATSGIQSCPAPQTVSTDGSYTLSGTAVDNAGNTQTILVPVELDQTAPVISNLTWSANPLTQGQSTTLSASVTDNLSGVASVYYTIDGGAPQAMTYDSTSNTWQAASFGSNLTSNTYSINVYATDQAGNLGAAPTDVLTVSSNSSVSGHAKLLPLSGDTLPIALVTATHNPTEFVVGFSSNNNGPNSIEAHYVVKNNKDEFDFNSTSVDWAVIPDTTHASIMVHGNMTTYVNGVKTDTPNVAMLVDVTLGTNGGQDQITVSLWMSGQDPNTTLPSYRVSEPDLANKSMVTIQ